MGVKEEEFPADALHMDAEQQFVPVEGRLSFQARTKEQLAYHVHDLTGGTQEIRILNVVSIDARTNKRDLERFSFSFLFLYESAGGIRLILSHLVSPHS